MAVQASVLFGRVRSMLDDDNSDRYSESDDLIPALNSAISYVTTVFTAAFEQKQVQPEVLWELTEIWIINPSVTGNTAKVVLTYNSLVFKDAVWRIIGVDPNPSHDAGSPEIFTESTLRFAKRLTIEEWNYALEDPFMPGTLQSIPSDFARVCYIGPGNYSSNDIPQLLLRPGSVFSATAARVGVWVLLKHTTIAASSGEILFPVSVHSLIEQKMLNYIAYQHDNPKYYQVTDKEVKELITLING